MGFDKFQKGLMDALESAEPVRISGTTTLGLNQRNILYDTSSAFTVTLPPVAEAQGLTFTFENVGGGNLTLVDGGDAGTSISDTTCQTAKDLLVYTSTGRFWYKVFET